MKSIVLIGFFLCCGVVCAAGGARQSQSSEVGTHDDLRVGEGQNQWQQQNYNSEQHIPNPINYISKALHALIKAIKELINKIIHRKVTPHGHTLSAVSGKDLAPDEYLQLKFNELFDRPQQIWPHPPYGALPKYVKEFLKKIPEIGKLCRKGTPFKDMHPPHRRALQTLIKLFLEPGRPLETIEFLKLARDHPKMNYRLWLMAVQVVTVIRSEMINLETPPYLQIAPEDFIPIEAQRKAQQEVQKPESEQTCIKMDGNVTAEGNGVEHKLWYWRENFMINGQHDYWHVWYTAGAQNLTQAVRRGELFYYFHHNLVARYNAERLSEGMDLVQPLPFYHGATIEEGYDSHLALMGATQHWTPRLFNTSFSTINGWPKIKDVISEDIKNQVVYYNETATISLKDNFYGINYLGDIVEADYQQPFNPERYDLKDARGYLGGLHNNIHDALAEISTPTPIPHGVMGNTATAIRDPAFFMWHKYVDALFQEHKVQLTPYPQSEGDFALRWPQVTISDLSVQSESSNGVKNLLQTEYTDFSVSVPYSADGKHFDDNVEYCIKGLNHKNFQYQLQIENSGTESAIAAVRIFMAPRNDANGQRFTFEEQRLYFFALDNFLVNLNPGSNQVTRESVKAIETLTRPWEFYNNTMKAPHCGCGLPHHLLIPKGTPQGMDFDLFAMVTLASAPSVIEPEVCSAAFILCGAYHSPYPDPKPMGYPFDRTTNLPSQSTLDDFIQPINNMKTVQVKIQFNESN